jgi:DNA gyrase/topoisomerase IV subunit B
MEILFQRFSFNRGLRIYSLFRWKSGAIIAHVISMDNEKGEIPVEVALIYNTSYSENIFSM